MRTHAARAPTATAPVAATKPVRAHPALCAILRAPIRPKLKIGAVKDPLEHEADRIADQVMRMTERDVVAAEAGVPPVVPADHDAAVPPVVSRKCATCGEEENLRRKPAEAQPIAGDAPAAVHEVLRSPGQPLDAASRAYFEPRFGHDFSQVRVHSGAAVERSARDVNARAYTVKHDIVFGPREYAPATSAGKRLLAHELAHVVQQGQSGPDDGSLTPKQGTQAQSSIASARASLALILRQKVPHETSGGQQGPAGKPEDREKQAKALCINEPVDAAKARCDFTERQTKEVRILHEHALRICNRAISGIDMPGNESEVERIANDYFHYVDKKIRLTDWNRRTFRSKVKAVANELGRARIACGTCQDENCNSGAIAHSIPGLIVLCPSFFNLEKSEAKKTMTPTRVLIHEGGHLAGLDRGQRIAEEFYCQGANKEDKCPVIDPIHNVDAWSHFIEELAYTI